MCFYLLTLRERKKSTRADLDDLSSVLVAFICRLSVSFKPLWWSDQMFFFTPSALAVVEKKQKKFFLCRTCSVSKRLCFRCALIDNSTVSPYLILDSKNLSVQIDLFIPETLVERSVFFQTINKPFIRTFITFQKKRSQKIVYMATIVRSMKTHHLLRVYLGKTSVVDEDLKIKLKNYFDRIITAIESLTPGEQKSLVFVQDDVSDETDNILIDCLISKEQLVQFEVDDDDDKGN